MNIFHAALLALVEGLTEFLPVSSTGHLILVSSLLDIAPTEFTKTFDVVIQLGAILAVCGMYAHTLIANPSYLRKILIAFLPTGVIGFLAYPFIKSFLLESTTTTIAMLALGGIALVIIDRRDDKAKSTTTIRELTTSNLLTIGLFQSLAMVPGVSRAAATIIGGRLIGLSRHEAVVFSFLLAIPTMIAATGWDLVKSYQYITPPDVPTLAIGFGGAFITAALAIKFFTSYIQRHSLAVFGWYRIGIALIFLLMVR